MKKIGKNNPKAEQICTDNQHRAMWNQTVDRALISGVPERQILEVKQSEIGRRAKQRKEMPEQTEQLNTQIANMKQRLSSIVQGYGYKNVKEFLSEYRASKAEYTDYQSAVAKSQQNGSKAEPDSLKVRLQKKQQEVKNREKADKAINKRR